MPPPPTYSTAILILHLLLPFVVAAAACSVKAGPSSVCPPFSSFPPPYPFSASPGCGHPSFQINCSSPHSTLSINHLSFSLLRFDLNSSSLLLSPSHSTASSATTHPANCSSSSRFPSIPSRSISLSGSPFRASDALCSRLHNLRPCGRPLSLNGTCCPWECELIGSPAVLLHDCGTTHRPASDQGCQGDVLEYLNKFLEMGIQVEWDLSEDTYFNSCRACQSGNGVCGYNSSDSKKHFICFHSQSRISPLPNHVKVMGLIIAITCLLLLVSSALAILRSRRCSSSQFEEDPTSMFLRRHRSLSLLPPVFTYEELESSTGNFDPNCKIGDGGFGSVYLGELPDGRAVAVKHLHRHRPTAAAAAARAFSAKSFCNEILILSSIDHPNLVKLHGYCSDPRGLLLVYDYVPNGTIADHLHGRFCHRRPPLTWQVRLDMAMQIGLAIEYLHHSVSPPVVHRDITSSNIFVDGDMRIKVGDFGLSRLLEIPDKMTSSSSGGSVWTGPQGTPGYLDPDYHRSFRLTEKSDVYSFGVILLELISGLRAVDQSRDKREFALTDFAVSRIQMGMLHQVVDPRMALDGAAREGVHAVAELAFRCVAADKDDRPDSREVVEELKRIRNKSH